MKWLLSGRPHAIANYLQQPADKGVKEESGTGLYPVPSVVVLYILFTPDMDQQLAYAITAAIPDCPYNKSIVASATAVPCGQSRYIAKLANGTWDHGFITDKSAWVFGIREDGNGPAETG
jgi:hypothetical protein